MNKIYFKIVISHILINFIKYLYYIVIISGVGEMASNKLRNSDKNKAFVETLYKYIPDTKELVNYLTETLSINKESVYRRLRNEVPFTFDEICTVVPKLGISLDTVIGLINEENTFFNFHMHKSSDPVNMYVETMEINLGLLTKLKNTENGRIELALNRLPLAYVLINKMLSEFYYYKWYYHTQSFSGDLNFRDLHLPDKIKNIYTEYIKENNCLNCEINIVFDNNIFISIIKDINYFAYQGLIHKHDVAELQQELLQTVDYLESITKGSRNKDKRTVNLYISFIDIEPCHLYLEYNDKACIYYWTPTGEILGSYNTEICSIQKKWMQSLKRYTTLITGCNTSKAIEYFDKQRRYIREKLSFSLNEEEMYDKNMLLPPFLSR